MNDDFGSLRRIKIRKRYDPSADVILYEGDARLFLETIPEHSVDLIVTSPPYNLGKEYEKQITLEQYKKEQSEIIDGCVPLLTDSGSICWQVGNYVSPSSEVVPLDILLYDLFKSHDLVLRNRIVWHFGHGLHSQRRFSGRYETIMWFTKSDDYRFDLDSVRVPQKYPGKRHFKGPKKGQYSGNPNGKNPGDFWITAGGFDTDVWNIPNVKAHHIEKTEHPCQFPIGLVQRLVRALTRRGSWVLDPFIGTGTTACAALIEGRRAMGSDIVPRYLEIAKKRAIDAYYGKLRYRPFDQPVYQPKAGSKLTTRGDDD